MPRQQATYLFSIPAPQGFYPRLAAMVVLLAALVNAGSMVSIDPVRRLIQARSLLTNAPEVTPGESTDFSTKGPDGRRHVFFGIGHALVLLPADAAAGAAVDALKGVTPLSDHARTGLRVVLAAFLSQALICSMAALFAYLLLRQLGFAHPPAAFGALSLPLGTTFLHYTQNCQENNLLLLCALAGAFFTARWLESEKKGDARSAAAWFGFALLVRLTSLGDLGGDLVFLALALYLRAGSTRAAAAGAGRFLRSFAPVYAVFLVLERIYQHHRFGGWFGTYFPGSSDSFLGWMQANPLFNHSFWSGIWEALLSPENSIFLFDPLLPLSLALLFLLWPRLDARVKALAAGALASLAVYVLFYARALTPTGEISWGDRFTETPVLLLCLLAVPMLWGCWENLHWAGRLVAGAVIAWSVLLQAASVLLMPNVEVIQSATIGSQWAIARRFANLTLILNGQASRAAEFAGIPAEWRTFNLLPWQLDFRFPALARAARIGWVVLFFLAVENLRRLRWLALSNISRAGISD
jgi:hypothetical protein